MKQGEEEPFQSVLKRAMGFTPIGDPLRKCVRHLQNCQCQRQKREACVHPASSLLAEVGNPRLAPIEECLGSSLQHL